MHVAPPVHAPPEGIDESELGHADGFGPASHVMS